MRQAFLHLPCTFARLHGTILVENFRLPTINTAGGRHMSDYYGQIWDLPTVTEGHFIDKADKRLVFGPNGRFLEGYSIRCFTMHPGAKSASHAHSWDHWAICLNGEGCFKVGEALCPLQNGTWVHVPGGVPHHFWNTSETEDMNLICMVPAEGDVNPLIMPGC